ncbi:MAG: hypothetical protein EB165_02760 [Euryarchaeota archaeon]|nr:hypothetical protein [Euryarchaeota archaeon]NDB93551.1 hypothetical protein [Euryarchaeota archaeon]
MWAKGHVMFNTDEGDEAEWVEHVKETYQGALLRNAKSFFTGYNSNIKGHEHGNTRYNIYNGGVPRYASIISEFSNNEYKGVHFQ